MAKGFVSRSHGSPNRASQARLSQKSGDRNSFGGYTKVSHGNGTFSMKKTGK